MSENDLNKQFSTLVPDIKRASKFVAYQWPGIMEAEDAYQAISLHIWEREGSLQKIAEMEPKARYRAIVGIGNQLASAERVDYDHFKGSFRYSVDEVKRALAEQILTKRDETKFSEIRMDLDAAMQALETKTPQYHQAIRKRYEQATVPTSGSDKDALKNGLTSLTNEMNRSHRNNFVARADGPGTRKAMSIRDSQISLDSDWDGKEPTR